MLYGDFAGVYDQLMRDVDYAAWAEYIIALFAGHDVHTVADCACGTGEISVRLQEAGYAVTGIDRSEDMLRVAQQKARQKGLRIPFIRQDMENLRLHKPVDAVCCACDGVNYLVEEGEARDFFSAAYTALRPGGLLLFDISSGYKFANILSGNVFGEAEEEIAFIWRNNYDEEARLCEMELTCFVKEGQGYTRFDERHIQRAYEIDETLSMLKDAGFRKASAYRAFTLEAPAENDERIQFVAVK